MTFNKLLNSLLYLLKFLQGKSNTLKQELNAVSLLSLTLPLVHFWKVQTISWDHSYSNIFAYDRMSPLYNMKAMSAFIPADYFLVSFKRALSALCTPVCMLRCVWLFETPRTVAHGVTPGSARLPVSLGMRQTVWVVLVQWGSQVARVVKNPPSSAGDPWMGKESLEEGVATLSSVLAWRIPGTEEPGGLQSRGSQRVGHDWSNLVHTHTLAL